MYEKYFVTKSPDHFYKANSLRSPRSCTPFCRPGPLTPPTRAILTRSSPKSGNPCWKLPNSFKIFGNEVLKTVQTQLETVAKYSGVLRLWKPKFSGTHKCKFQTFFEVFVSFCSKIPDLGSLWVQMDQVEGVRGPRRQKGVQERVPHQKLVL